MLIFLTMLYYSLKILHIISATLLLTSMAYSIYLWRSAALAERIQIQTVTIIVPAAIFQLLTGFTLISLQHEDISQWWIRISVTGFLIMMMSWFGFLYCLHHQSLKQWQQVWLILCVSTLVSMIFFMANKI